MRQALLCISVFSRWRRCNEDPMKITAVETIRLQEFANIIWVRLHTDDGSTASARPSMGAAAVEAYIHETVAPKLIGRDPLQIEGINDDHRRIISAGVRPASKRAAIPPSTSPCGISSARRTASPSATCWAAGRATRSASTTPAPVTGTSATPRPESRQLGHRRRGRTLRGSRRASCTAPTSLPTPCWSRASPA